MLRLLLLLAALAPAALAADESDLPAGRYSVRVGGMVATVCARAIAAEWAKLPQVEAVSYDFDRETLFVTVRLDKALPVWRLRRRLRAAAGAANLGGRYELGEIEYLR